MSTINAINYKLYCKSNAFFYCIFVFLRRIFIFIFIVELPRKASKCIYIYTPFAFWVTNWWDICDCADCKEEEEVFLHPFVYILLLIHRTH